MCTCVCVCTHTCTQDNLFVIPQEPSTFFVVPFAWLGFARDRAFGLELTKSLTGLASQETPGTLSLPAQLRDR